jgi:5-methylcytosine-specific restriction endonuclease McrA
MNCGDTFAVVKGRTAGEQAPRYCSAECKYAHFQLHKRNRIAKVCPVCGKAFETYPSHDNTYCSYTCMGVAKERKEERVCATCGDTFTVKKSLVDICCSWECRVERLRGENHASWRGGKLPNYAGDWQRQKRRARERDGNVCQRCGKTAQENGENMSVHHIRPYRSFDDPVEANRLDNLESLCRNCHMKIKD